MKPKKVGIPQETILEAAWKLVRESGPESLSARKLAARLGSSTMPIYSGVGSMSELSRTLGERVAAALREYQARSWTGNPMLDAAIGYVMFARDERQLFKFLWVAEKGPGESGEQREALEKIFRRTGGREMMDGNPAISKALGAMTKTERADFSFHVWIFVHGIAVLASEGVLELDDKTLIGHLEAAGEAFYQLHVSRKKGGR